MLTWIIFTAIAIGFLTLASALFVQSGKLSEDERRRCGEQD